MRHATQSLVLTLVGVVLLKLVLSDAYLFYVKPWMMWPLVVSAVFLLVLALTSVARAGHGHAPATAWLLLVPVLLVFVVRPAPLGSYLAERRGDETAQRKPPGSFQALPARPNPRIPVWDFVVRAVHDPGRSLEDKPVTLVGFVSRDEGEGWLLTRLSLSCCAGDASVSRVRVLDDRALPRDQWVRVVGTWVPPEPGEDPVPPELTPATVRLIDRPAQPYE